MSLRRTNFKVFQKFLLYYQCVCGEFTKFDVSTDSAPQHFNCIVNRLQFHKHMIFLI